MAVFGRVPNDHQRCPASQIFYPQGSVISGPIVMKLFTHITDNILQQVTVAEF